MKGKSSHLVNVPEASSGSTNFDLDYYNEHGDPVYAHMVSTLESIQNNQKKHLIQFSISVDLEKVRNLVEHSKTKCPTVLLKTDTGADVNLMNSYTFDTLFKDRTILQPSSLRMETYGSNSSMDYLESSMQSSDGKERFTDNCSMSQKQIIHLIYFQWMVATL